MQKILLIAVACFIYLPGFAQQLSVDTIRWNTIELTDLNTNETVANEIYFVSQGNHSVKWVQNGGQVQIEFSVTSVEGQWPDAALPGTLTFQITDGTATGSLKFTKSSQNEVFVELHLRGTTSGIDMRYKINSYSKL
ncbi:MAG: hypothetical protein KF775_11950 [Cyclobacteriaceae bacterium]|nr:hypothetical protein [Cyclobacteriaceae bacterium]